ncbi:hypothetical protein ACTTAI_14085 [Rhodobacter capsulatus]|uniref:hypothetical protein n=1 Tax=Rhodobacter capsulatus TaxID=1061 RepID=UPI004028BF70
MLTPEEFLKADTPPRFEIAVDKLRIRDRDVGAARIPVSYDADWTPVFHLGEFVEWREAFNVDGNTDFSFECGGYITTLFLKRCTFPFHGEPSTVEARARRIPIHLGQAAICSSFSAVLLSPPEFLSRTIRLVQPEGVIFEIVPSGVMGNPCLISSTLGTGSDDVVSDMGCLHGFLTFVKGSHCGVGNLIAHDANGAVAFSLLGFTPNDSGKIEPNWLDRGLQQDLPTIFLAFCSAHADNLTRRALLQGIEYYRASNVLRSASIEMAIIAAHTALEALVNYILEHRAGWSKSLMAEKGIKFSDKMRAAATFLRIDCDLLEQSPELRALSKSRNNMDAFDLISFIRNKLVHQDAAYQPQGLQMHEAWLLAQWLVEVLIFGIIGYRGKIRDRRLYKGWGGTMELPFKA